MEDNFTLNNHRDEIYPLRQVPYGLVPSNKFYRNLPPSTLERTNRIRLRRLYQTGTGISATMNIHLYRSART